MKRFTHPWVCRKPVTSSSSSHEAQLSHISLLKLWKEKKKHEIKSSQNAVICHLIPLKTTLGSSCVSCSLLLSFLFSSHLFFAFLFSRFFLLFVFFRQIPERAHSNKITLSSPFRKQYIWLVVRDHVNLLSHRSQN